MAEMKKYIPEAEYEIRKTALYAPVLDMDERRRLKEGFRELPIDKNHPKFTEPVVDIAEYGLAGQAYYSRPNATTGEAIPGVPTSLYLRKSIAEELGRINRTLTDPVITNFFGDEVELYIQDALRPVSLQKRLHDEFVPALLRKNQPGISDKELNTRLKDIIGRPSTDPLKPSPHATGGAVDVVLRFKQDTKGYVQGSRVPIGHVDGETSPRIAPDYFEQNQPQTEDDKLAQRNRRAFYAIMNGSAFGIDTGLVNNPTEWWHWGRGDQLSEKIRGSDSAYYSLAEAQV